jgi:hypothetical protein
LANRGFDFKMLSYGSEIMNVNFEGLGAKFESDFADICAKNNELRSKGVQ